MKLILFVAAFLSVVLFLIAARNIKNAVPDAERDYMDPLPPMLRMAWPLVSIFAFYFGERFPTDVLEYYYRQMRRSGVTYLMTADELVGLKILAALCALGVAGLIMWLLEAFDIFYLPVAFFIGWILPSLSLRDRRKKREAFILKQLPTFLDFLTMAVQAGMNLSGAITQSIEKGPAGPLKIELEKVMRDIRAGMHRIDALRAMAERLELKEVTSFVSAVAQAEKTGSSLGATLKIQADQRRVERFQRAEKMAMEAPVKLIFPLVAFIFPMTFIVLGFPIAMKFLYEM
ncbi:tight adherence protein C [Marinobacter daqiaonensis]|uniref:Tight adherence protein C n=1 Tax=Marinobacter daqiaonensis TaxID=650891 RepID=A0A1I6I7K1_9GAMM|nr:type II secretion system F family protein [Marinobacter daqiaonensis]SFR62712.1 tight adherence protein C [Marinobacter daqiaonensis]